MCTQQHVDIKGKVNQTQRMSLCWWNIQIPKHDLPDYSQNHETSLRLSVLKGKKNSEEKLDYYTVLCVCVLYSFLNTLRKLDKITTLSTISETVKDIIFRGHPFDSPFKFSC